MSWHAVARESDLKSGDVVGVTVDGAELIVGRDGDTYFASPRRCPHRGYDLADGIVSRGHVICPQHGWRFSTATGKTPEPSEYCLAMYPVRVVEGTIEVEVSKGSECPPSA